MKKLFAIYMMCIMYLVVYGAPLFLVGSAIYSFVVGAIYDGIVLSIASLLGVPIMIFSAIMLAEEASDLYSALRD